jgi:hypothetical protein
VIDTVFYGKLDLIKELIHIYLCSKQIDSFFIVNGNVNWSAYDRS